LLAALVRRGRRGGTLVGPLFFYELIRLARRGRSTLLRTCYALALLAGLYLVYTSRFPQHDLLARPFAPGPNVTLSARADLAASFVGVILALQEAAVLVLTPVYLAGAVAEEREQRTLELLFTTHLRDREIILGKLFSRLTHLAVVLLAGVPIMSLLQIWGGVDVRVLLAGVVVTGVTLLSVGAVSILISVVARDVLTAVLASYLIVFAVAGLCAPLPFSSPLAFQMELEEHTGVYVLRRLLLGQGTGPGTKPASLWLQSLGGNTAAYAFVHGSLAVICIGIAIRNLRHAEVDDRPQNRAVMRRVENWDAPVPVRRLPRHQATGLRFPVTDWPLLWKEVYHRAGDLATFSFRQVFFLSLTLGLIYTGLILLGGFLNGKALPPVRGDLSFRTFANASEFMQTRVNPFLRALVITLAALWCLCAALRSASSITREREGRTLGSLLILPMGSSAVLGAKWVGSILRYRQLGYLLAAVLSLGLLSTALHPLAVLLLVLACGVHLVFLAGLGVWLSLVSRTTLWAHFSMVLMLLVVFGGWFVAEAYSHFLFGTGLNQAGWWGSFVAVGLNPGRTWWYFGLSWNGFSEEMAEGFRGTFGAALAGVGVFAALSGALWLAACGRLRREPFHGAGRGK
jgi:ABC-type transport system involved in multi-copper enzyme maturation permease subunit